jgi:hypothetical protein
MSRDKRTSTAKFSLPPARILIFNPKGKSIRYTMSDDRAYIADDTRLGRVHRHFSDRECATIAADFRAIAETERMESAEVAQIKKVLSRIDLDYDLYKLLKAAKNNRLGDHSPSATAYLLKDGSIERRTDGFELTAYGQTILHAAERLIAGYLP